MVDLVRLAHTWNHTWPEGEPYSTGIQGTIGGDLIVWADHAIEAEIFTYDRVPVADWTQTIVGSRLVLTPPSGADTIPAGDLKTVFRIDGSEILAGAVRVKKAGTPGTDTDTDTTVTIDTGTNVIELTLLFSPGDLAAAGEAVAAHVAATDPHGDRAFATSAVSAEAVTRASADTALAGLITAEATTRAAGDTAAISTAATDATTKANAAQAAAISAAATDATTQVAAEATTRAAADAAEVTARNAAISSSASTERSVSDSRFVQFKQLAKNPDLLVNGTITRDANEAATSFPVLWPDGQTGIYTADTVSTAFPGAVDGYHITYVPTSGPTVTYTQPTITRDASGAATAVPAITVA